MADGFGEARVKKSSVITSIRNAGIEQDSAKFTEFFVNPTSVVDEVDLL